MVDSFLQKTEALKKLFANCTTVESKYQKIIELGKSQPRLGSDCKTEATRVQGCQSVMYLVTRFEGGKLYFQTEADAIISSGLGMLLTLVYSGETAEVILRQPPKYIEELGIAQTLTPGRANGLASIYVRMKQEALTHLKKSIVF